MAELRLHVGPSGKRWYVRRSGALRAWKLFDTKEEAGKAAMRVFPRRRDGVLYIHDETGRIVRRVCRPAIIRR